MKSIRLLPVVILAISALLVLKTLSLATTGSYMLGGVTAARAEEASHAAPAGGDATDAAITLPDEPTMADGNPTMADGAPTLGQADTAGEHAAEPADHAAPAPAEAPGEAAPAAAHGEAAPAEGEHAADETALADGLQTACAPNDAIPAAKPTETDAAVAAEPATATDAHGAAPTLAAGLVIPDCVPLIDAVPMRLDANGQPVPLASEDGQTMSEKALLERLAERRTQLDSYEQELALRASLVDAAEKKIDARQATLQALETQISTLVDQRKELETGQFAGIVTLYENMKPKDAANIFNALDMEVLLRVAKSMNPRKMSPILAAMDAARAQELTVRMAALSDQPAEQMSPDDLAALPQIVGQ